MAEENMKPWARLLYRSFFPLLLITLPPVTVILFWHTNKDLGGSLLALYEHLSTEGWYNYIRKVWPRPDALTYQIIGVYALFELILLKVIPGKQYEAPLTPMGEVPVYKANGFQAFVVSHIAYVIAYRRGLFAATTITDRLGQIFAATNIIGFTLCIFLYFKGRYWPSSKDHSTTGNLIFDFYWGTELHPRILGIDVKHFVNCRVAMMSWSLLLVTYCLAQYEQTGHVCEALMVSSGIQFVYVLKFFVWETGYLASIDIIHDRGGYYILWGVLCWLPCIYTSSGMYLFYNPIHLSTQQAWTLFGLGVWAVYINYESDEQRAQFRNSNGQALIWGRKPQYIKATYSTETGEEKNALLLTDGWWSVSRHFNYFAELASCFLWVPPVQFDTFMPYFYFFYMIILLVHRERRDDARCKKKYGKYYEEYKRRVPNRIFPGIY